MFNFLRKDYVVLVTVVMLSACDERMRTVDSFTIDDCTIKEVQQGGLIGRSIYIAHCKEKSTTVSWSEQHGKTTRNVYSITQVDK